tara:strand:- start:9257 stop:10243 length:987 start_codon:yes stop_codon:yes gene_type:complete
MAMTPEMERRAMLAVDRMLTLNEGLYSAARNVGTTRATVLKWLALKNIGYRKVAYGRYKIEPPMEARVRQFLSGMAQGRSATAAAKRAGTTLRAMQKQTLNDGTGKQVPIIGKVGNRWESNFVPLYDHSMVVYGKLVGLEESLQGRPGQTAGPKAQRNQKKADEDYADIWWQFDLNNFVSSLSAAGAAAFWKPALVTYLRQTLEAPSITNANVAKTFVKNAKVTAHALSNGRIDGAGKLGELTVLEDMMERYDLRLDKTINTGVDDNRASVTNIPDFVAKTDPKVTSQRNTDGYFQVFFLRKGGLEVYPPAPGLKLVFNYSVADERIA